jgi:hypothetical protein
MLHKDPCEVVRKKGVFSLGAEGFAPVCMSTYVSGKALVYFSKIKEKIIYH